MTIHCSTTPCTLTCWWERQDADGYTVVLDGEMTIKTEKTHCTFRGLLPASAHTVELRDGQTVLGAVRAKTMAALRRLDVRSFGAAGDGTTDDTDAIQAAIDACGGSDEVYFPAGTYRSGALTLHSDMAIYLEKGAVLQGSEDPKDYLPMIRSRFEGTQRECYRSLLNLGQLDHDAGPNCENVLIYGEGVISGGGKALASSMMEAERARLRDYLAENAELVAACENENTIPGRVRGRLINLSNCQNVRITGLRLQKGPAWNVHMIYSRDIITDHCDFFSDGVWNGDGWDPDSSENCTLFACTFRTSDDSVAIKSGKNPEGNLINRPTRGIRIFDCVSRFGKGIAMGSEMSGGIEDVVIWDCDLVSSECGLEIKATAKRGGYVRNITVKNCALPRVMVHSVEYNNDGEAAPVPPVLENFLFEDVSISGRYRDFAGERAYHECSAIEIEGFDIPGHEVKNVIFRQIVFPDGKRPVVLCACDGVCFEGVSLSSRQP